jgi:hypothetical protein
MTTPAPSKAEQLLARAVAQLGAIKAGAEYWYTPGEVSRDWKNYDEVQGWPFYGVIEGRTAPAAGADTQDGGGLMEQTLIVVAWVNEDKIPWGAGGKSRRVAIQRAAADVVRALTARWPHRDEWLHDVSRPSIETDEAALVAKPYAYAEVTLTYRYWCMVGEI